MSTSRSVERNDRRPVTSFRSSKEYQCQMKEGASIPQKPIMLSCIFRPISKIIINNYFHKIFKFPYFREIDLYFCLIYLFCFPLFYHDAFMHHALHALDARVYYRPTSFTNLDTFVTNYYCGPIHYRVQLQFPVFRSLLVKAVP